MPRTIWEWLGIEETTDKTLIRKAYAEQSKIYHPEECPEEAQKLREAYKRAMALSSSEKKPLYFSSKAENISSNQNEGLYEYRLSSPADRKEKEPSGQGDEEQLYEYLFSSLETGKEKEPTDRKEKEPSDQGDEERLYEYPVLVPDFDRKKRIHELAGQLIFLYESSAYRRGPRVWKFVFENYPRKDDLKDPRMIAELVSVIEQMPYLEKPVWKVLEAQIFRYSGKNPDWMLLRDRFRAVKQAVDTRQLKRMNQGKPKKSSSGLLLAASRELYGAGSRMYKKYRFRVMASAAVTIAMGIFILFGALYWSSEAQEQRKKAKQQEIIEKWRQEIHIVQEDNGNKMPGASHNREYFQHLFTPEQPYDIDLNNDRLPDHIYYDAEQGCFIAAFYDSDTGTYRIYGTVEQYLEEYPDMRNTFLPFLTGK